jgi:hypothetical protein
MSRAAARWVTKEPKKQQKIKIKKHLQDLDLSSGPYDVRTLIIIKVVTINQPG